MLSLSWKTSCVITLPKYLSDEVIKLINRQITVICRILSSVFCQNNGDQPVVVWRVSRVVSLENIQIVDSGKNGFVREAPSQL